MTLEEHPAERSDSARGAGAEVVAFLAGRSAPCPRCGYDLRDIKRPECPECGEPLELQVGSTRVRFGWLVLAMAPGCFSGVAAVFVLIPIGATVFQNYNGVQALPWPVAAADAFGFLSAGSVGLMYRHRHRILAWPTRRQGVFAAAVWTVHALVFVVLFTCMWLWH